MSNSFLDSRDWQIMKPSPLGCSWEAEELGSVAVPQSPGLKKSHSVWSGLGQEGGFPFVDPDEEADRRSNPEEALLHNEALEISANQNQGQGDESQPNAATLSGGGGYSEDHGRKASADLAAGLGPTASPRALRKVRSLPNLAACRSSSARLPRSQSAKGLSCTEEGIQLEIPFNPFEAASSGPVGDSGGVFMEFREGPGRDEVFMEDGRFGGGAATDEGHIQNMRRIEEWVRQIDVEDGSFVEELEERSPEPKERRDPTRPIPRGSGGSTGGAEAAHRYISALAPSSTSAQMMNLGLVVIPFLGAFTSLRALDLSGNAIVRMTSGALPRGLHVLNLSRNNISAIEGLRELTRLRVLDLSYNRILRIGHGLAGCSSLKELYLGGNKIGEVEGLHRLLKLSVLDLRGNKISTAKSLGQLAANYASLQAVNLEGNPAQRNVGEEQLRRHLLGLLPRLVYFNRHAVRAVSSKDLADRAAAAALADRGGVRSDHRRAAAAAARRGVTPGGGPLKASAPAAGGRWRGARGAGAAATPPKPVAPSKGHGAVPGIGGRLLSGLRPTNPLRRIRSEGAL